MDKWQMITPLGYVAVTDQLQKRTIYTRKQLLELDFINESIIKLHLVFLNDKFIFRLAACKYLK